MMENIVKILIADDHQIFIDGIKALLRSNTKFKITEEALNAEKALEIIKKQDIDVLLTDISMPEMGGVALTKIVKSDYPDIKVIVLTMYNEQEVVHDIMMSEAEGYILKNTGRDELLKALETVHDNSTYYSQEVLLNVMQKVKNDKRIDQEISHLTERELEVLQLICEEHSSDEIANKLYISKRTVDVHRQHIYEKTKCKTIVSLIKFSIRNNLVNI